MRKILPVIATIVVLVLSGIQGLAQKDKDKDGDRHHIKGSGNVVTRDVAIQSFDQLDASGVYNLILIQADKESLKIEAEDNLQELFEIKNEGSKLVIGMKKNPGYDSKKKLKVYLSFKNLKSLDLAMVGNVTCSGKMTLGDFSLGNKSVGSVDLSFSAQKLDISNSAVGNLTLSGKAENAVIKSNSVGSIRASDLLVQKMDIDNDGIGGAEVNAVQELKVKDSFLGKVRNAGSAPVKRRNKVVI